MCLIYFAQYTAFICALFLAIIQYCICALYIIYYNHQEEHERSKIIWISF
nr:MAG TPA_asm: hypothetical protein [Caudoviricetes sp.]